MTDLAARLRQLEAALEHERATRDDALAAALRMVEALRETNTRLNRRCQAAEAAANLRVEAWDKRSQKAGRTYLWALAQWSVMDDVYRAWMGAETPAMFQDWLIQQHEALERTRRHPHAPAVGVVS